MDWLVDWITWSLLLDRLIDWLIDCFSFSYSSFFMCRFTDGFGLQLGVARCREEKSGKQTGRLTGLFTRSAHVASSHRSPESLRPFSWFVKLVLFPWFTMTFFSFCQWLSFAVAGTIHKSPSPCCANSWTNPWRWRTSPVDCTAGNGKWTPPSLYTEQNNGQKGAVGGTRRSVDAVPLVLHTLISPLWSGKGSKICFVMITWAGVVVTRCRQNCIVPAVFGRFLDPPGNHPRGAIFPTVD